MDKFCGKCGAEIPVGNGFCVKCGTMISMDTGTPPTTQPVSNVVQTTQNQVEHRATNKDGIISLVLFGVAVVSFYLCTSVVDDDVLMFLFIILMFGSLIVSVVSGIMGICKKGAPKTAAVTGFVLSLCVLLYFIIGTVVSYNQYNQENNSRTGVIWDENGIQFYY